MAHSLLSRIEELDGKLLPMPSDPSHDLQVRKDLEALQRMVRRIHAVLQDAEEREIHDESVKLWLRELKSVAYDANDVLDEFEYELLRAKVEMDISEVSEMTIASIPLNVSLCGKIAGKVENIRGRFEEISRQRDALHLREADGARQFQNTTGRPSSSHLVDAPNIYGRRGDLEKVINQLLCSNECKESNLSVLPIVGMGGVGKTTLVQHIYNDQRVCNHFSLRGWICVSDDLIVERLTAKIIEALTQKKCHLNELSALQMRLIQILDGKRFLLVLDDVWNRNPRVWESLQKPLIFGAPGSAVITTTRDESVAKIMQTMPSHHLDCLPLDDCWAVFRESAFVHQVPNDHPDLIRIGYKIVEKCRGLPLAAKSLGSLLCYENNVDKWEEVLQSNTWILGDQGDGIIPALMLSYVYLPSYLKQCFLYTSLFPKDFIFIKEDLILQWMAQGFLQCKGSKQAEDVGDMYFSELVQRSFFQCYSRSLGKEEPCSFVMHDLIHDLAQHVSDREFFHMQAENAHVPCPSEVRHVSVLSQRVRDLTNVFHSLSNCAPWAIRTLRIKGMRWTEPELKFPSQMIPHLEFLRVLYLRYTNIHELPDSVGNLKLLRYLNLGNTEVARLPDSVCRLYNLQTLCLQGCNRLITLPKNVRDLSNLRCLKINRIDACVIPRGIGKLINLRLLDEFMVGRKWRFVFGGFDRRKEAINLLQMSNAEYCSGIEELKDLIHLRGALEISNLQHVMNAEDARLADLRNKRGIKELYLNWYLGTSFHKDEFPFEAAPLAVQMQVMENLRPPGRLQVLRIERYDGLSFPSWMAHDPSSLSKLIHVKLRTCRQWTTLPPLGQLPSLKHLEIEQMDMVEAIGPEFCGQASVGFPALEELHFSSMSSCVTWEVAAGRGDFPRLRRLWVSACPSLESMVPLYLLPSLEVFGICLCPKLTSIELGSGSPSISCFWASSLPKGPPPLRKMSVKSCPRARFSPEDDRQLWLPPTLIDLDIDWACPLLVEWCEGGRGRRLAHIPNAKVWKFGNGQKMVVTWKNVSTSLPK